MSIFTVLLGVIVCPCMMMTRSNGETEEKWELCDKYDPTLNASFGISDFLDNCTGHCLQFKNKRQVSVKGNRIFLPHEKSLLLEDGESVDLYSQINEEELTVDIIKNVFYLDKRGFYRFSYEGGLGYHSEGCHNILRYSYLNEIKDEKYFLSFIWSKNLNVKQLIKNLNKNLCNKTKFLGCIRKSESNNETYCDCIDYFQKDLFDPKRYSLAEYNYDTKMCELNIRAKCNPMSGTIFKEMEYYTGKAPSPYKCTENAVCVPHDSPDAKCTCMKGYLGDDDYKCQKQNTIGSINILFFLIIPICLLLFSSNSSN